MHVYIFLHLFLHFLLGFFSVLRKCLYVVTQERSCRINALLILKARLHSYIGKTMYYREIGLEDDLLRSSSPSRFRGVAYVGFFFSLPCSYTFLTHGSET